MSNRPLAVRGYTLESIGKAKDHLNHIEYEKCAEEVAQQAREYRDEFWRLFFDAEAMEGERPAPAVVYYLKTQILDLLGLEPDDTMDYDMTDERFLREEENDEGEDDGTDHGEYEFLDSSDLHEWWKSL